MHPWRKESAWFAGPRRSSFSIPNVTATVPDIQTGRSIPEKASMLPDRSTCGAEAQTGPQRDSRASTRSRMRISRLAVAIASAASVTSS